jgi:hypothetical protein
MTVVLISKAPSLWLEEWQGSAAGSEACPVVQPTQTGSCRRDWAKTLSECC